MSRPPAIQLERLRIVRGGNTVLNDVTVSVSEGIITGLLGPSGCGKTTLMRTVVGNQKITAGSATGPSTRSRATSRGYRPPRGGARERLAENARDLRSRASASAWRPSAPP